MRVRHIPMVVLRRCVMPALICQLTVFDVSGQTLEISVPKTAIALNENLSLNVLLKNTTERPFFVTARVKLDLGNPDGRYKLQYRKIGETTYRENLDGYLSEIGRLDTIDQFIAYRNLVPLEPGAFIGRTLPYSPTGLFPEIQPGRYELRMVYEAKQNRFANSFLQAFGMPMLTGVFTSNVVEIEVR